MLLRSKISTNEPALQRLINGLLITLVLSMTLLSNQLIAAETNSYGIVLQYHHVSSNTPKSTSLSTAQFNKHMDWLAEHHYQVWPLPRLLAAIKNGEPVPDHTVAITFDDGYGNVYDNAYPILKARNWPFTIFVNTKPIAQKSHIHSDWAELNEMAKHGASIANHTTKHSYLVRRKNNEDTTQWLQRVISEIEDAEQIISEKTGQSHKILAYPYGEATPSIQSALADRGYMAFGQQSGPIDRHSDFTMLSRFPLSGVYSGIKSFAQKMRSLPMPVSEIQVDERSVDGILAHEVDIPTLTLSLEDGKYRYRELNCFASGQGQIQTQHDHKNYVIRANTALANGRSRYNCTMPSQQNGRYHWYSYTWIKQGPNKTWVHH